MWATHRVISKRALACHRLSWRSRAGQPCCLRLLPDQSALILSLKMLLGQSFLSCWDRGHWHQAISSPPAVSCRHLMTASQQLYQTDNACMSHNKFADQTPNNLQQVSRLICQVNFHIQLEMHVHLVHGVADCLMV